MTPRPVRVLLWLAAIAAVLFAGAWLVLDRWLESAGGRATVEGRLGAALGFPVRLGGEFGVRLLPSIGVGGTDFLAGESLEEASGVFLRGRAYLVELAPGPLWRGELQLSSLRLEGGHVDLSLVPETRPDTAPAPRAAPAWTIGELRVRDFEVRGISASPWRISALRIEEFKPGANAPFDLLVDDLGRLQGRFRWDPAAADVELAGAWTGKLPGRLDLLLNANLESGGGDLAAAWKQVAPDGEPGAELWLEYAGGQQGFRIGALRAQLGGQSVDGEGCLRTDAAASLNLELQAASLDLDALPEWPGGGAGPGPDAGAAIAWLEQSLRLRLRVGELRSGGTTARGVDLRLGPDPDCAGLE